MWQLVQHRPARREVVCCEQRQKERERERERERESHKEIYLLDTLQNSETLNIDNTEIHFNRGQVVQNDTFSDKTEL